MAKGSFSIQSNLDKNLLKPRKKTSNSSIAKQTRVYVRGKTIRKT